MRKTINKIKKIKLNNNQKKLLTVLKFLIIFNLLSIPLHVIIYLNMNLYPLALIERAHVSLILKIFNIEHIMYDVMYNNGQIPAIDINNHVLAIGEPCTAFRSLLAFTALVIATPGKKLQTKKKGLIYLPIIYIFNILRIVTLALITTSYPSIFELVHMFLWREGLILLIIGIWIYWFRKNE